jgi:phage regulator Rha-like protein
MLDRDLAEMYGVETKRLKEQVKRNIERFPEDFMFEMTSEELKNWRSQFATSNSEKMGLRYTPFCFTENGVLMLSSVLNSERAIQVNIQIVRVFNKLRNMLNAHETLLEKMEELEDKYIDHNEKISHIFKLIKEMLIKPEPTIRESIGFKIGGNK